MMRRRPHPGHVGDSELSQHYERALGMGDMKTSRSSESIPYASFHPTDDEDESKPTEIPFLGVSIGTVALLFIVLLLVVAEHLDSVHLNNGGDQYGPNNRIPVGIETSQRAMRNRTDHSLARESTTNLNRTVEGTNHRGPFAIPYIRYGDPQNSLVLLKDGMDDAARKGDADNPHNPNNTAGQHLLDFGIIGFPKCGTTTMMRWLNLHDQIAVIDQEIMALQKNHPVRILRFVQNQLPEGRYRRGYKSPSDVEDGRARNKLRIHYPKTKLMVGLRHPVWWFQSFYNHRVQNGRTMPDLEQLLKEASNPRKLREDCGSRWNGACIRRANFHTALAKWGKTPLLAPPPAEGGSHDLYDSFYSDSSYRSDDEWKLFSKTDQKQLRNEYNATEVSPNPLFLYDVSQLHMPTESSTPQKEREYHDFVESLQEFLGVQPNASAMPAMIREKPGRTEGVNATEQARRDALKIDLCREEFSVVREWLTETGSRVAAWISSYLTKSAHGVVLGGGTDPGDGSSRLLAILASYGEDPCP